MRVTIKEVAKLAGVSPSTVTRVVQNKSSISDETMFQHFRKARFQLRKGQCAEIISKKENLLRLCKSSD